MVALADFINCTNSFTGASSVSASWLACSCEHSNKLCSHHLPGNFISSPSTAPPPSSAKCPHSRIYVYLLPTVFGGVCECAQVCCICGQCFSTLLGRVKQEGALSSTKQGPRQRDPVRVLLDAFQLPHLILLVLLSADMPAPSSRKSFQEDRGKAVLRYCLSFLPEWGPW